ncbi:MAG: methyltransferase domain-containing protein [Caldilineaceae bacterium]
MNTILTTPSNPQTSPAKASRPDFAHLVRPNDATAQITRLLLACHAESVQSSTSRLSSDEVGLSAKGWEQTIALADWLQSHEEIDFLVTDSALRSRFTGQRLGQALGLSMKTAPYLPKGAEADWALHPPQAAPNSSDLEALSRYTAYYDALMPALERLLAEQWGKTTLLVTDAVTIATLVRSFTGSQSLGVRVSLTSLTEFQFHEGYWALAYANRTEHLPQGARSIPVALPEASTADPSPYHELTAEASRAAQFYNQVAQKLGRDPNTDQEDDHTRPPEVDAEMIQRFGGLENDSHLLMVGVGSGKLALGLAQAGIQEVIGVDISPGMLERAEFLRLATQEPFSQEVNFRLAPARSLPFADGRFDAVLCVHLLHHLAKPLAALQEFYRILPAHGRLIVIDIDGSTDAVKRATQNAIESKRNPTHATIRTRDQWVDLLEQSGFRVENEQTWTSERNAAAWLDSVAVDDSIRMAVTEMLEASIETDAAGLHVRRQDTELRFDASIIAFLARKAAT